MENLDSIQDSIFILVYKLFYTETDAMNLERWVSKRRISQYEKYQKEKQKQMEELKNQNKNFSKPSMR
jgi:hypothetical protein